MKTVTYKIWLRIGHNLNEAGEYRNTGHILNTYNQGDGGMWGKCQGSISEGLDLSEFKNRSPKALE